MGIVDGVKNIVGGREPQIPIPAPSYPEFSGMYAAWEQEDMSGTAGLALDNSSLIIKIESFLSGRELVTVKDRDGKNLTKWEQVAEPKMNERGVRAVVMEVRSRLDKNSIMTFFPNYDELLKFMEYFSLNITVFLGKNAQYFDIKHSYLEQIADFIVDNVLITLQRGIEGNEKQGIYKQSKRIENYTVPMNSPALMRQGQGGFFK